MSKKDDEMKKRMQVQLNNIDKLNADTSYESKTKLIEKRKVSELKELPENYIIPALRKDYYQRLYENIKQYGVKNPLIISKDNYILDGNHRFKITKELGGNEIDVIVKDIPSEQHLIYAIEEALNRRQLNDAQRADLILRRKEEYQKLCKENSLQNLKKGSKAPERVESNPVGRTREVLAKRAGISVYALKKSDKIKKENPKLFEKVKEGKISIHNAYNQVKKPKPIPKAFFHYTEPESDKKGILDWKSDKIKKEIVIFFEDIKTQEIVYKGIRKFIKENKIPFTRGKL